MSRRKRNPNRNPLYRAVQAAKDCRAIGIDRLCHETFEIARKHNLDAQGITRMLWLASRRAP